MYLLDTDICSYVMRRYSQRVTDRFSSAPIEELAMSAISQAEIYYGFAVDDVGLQRRLAAEAFFQSVVVLDWPAKAAQTYARLRARLKSAGVPIGDHDVMIAAHALTLGATLVTNNTRHFGRIAELKVENWLD